MFANTTFNMMAATYFVPIVMICLFTLTMAYKTEFKPKMSWWPIVILCVVYVLIGLTSYQMGREMIQSV